MGKIAMGLFEHSVETRIYEFLPEEYQNAEIHIRKVSKTKCMKTALVVKRPDKNYGPTVYMDSFYDSYRNGKGLDLILQELADIVVDGYEKGADLSNLNIADHRNKVCKVLVNRELNKGMLDTCPHPVVEDLAAIYRIDLFTDEETKASVLVSYSVMDYLGYENEQELEDAAKSYMAEHNQPVVMSMYEMLEKLMNEMNMEMPEEIDIESKENNMIIITNENRMEGAIYMLDKDVMDSVCDKCGPVIILPSSRHEVIAVPENVMDADAARSMVREVNKCEVEVTDRLSDNIYSYSKEKGLKMIKEDRVNSKTDIERYIDR